MDNDKITGYVTKWVMTRGIIRYDNMYVDKFDEHLGVRVNWQGHHSFKIGRDVFLTLDEAVIAAEAAREKYIAAAERRLARLKAKDFRAALVP